ncbi:MAG: secretin N-terminal domain-containing protein [Candidatus Omnitrophota bacterium]
MKKGLFRVNSLIFIFLFCLFLPKLSADLSAPFPDLGPEISMDFKDADLKDILKILSIQSGLNFIASEVVQDRTITLYLDKVPLNMAMDKLFKANNLSYELDEEAKIFIVKEWGKLAVETITRIFFLKYASVSSSSLKSEMSKSLGGEAMMVSISGGESQQEEGGKWASEQDVGLTKAVKNLLTEHGSLIEDYRTNSLIVTDTPRNMKVIASIIASLDVLIPQVLLEVEILDVSKDVVDDMGIQWTNPFASLNVVGQRLTTFPFGGSGTSGFGRTGTDDALNEAWVPHHFAPSVLTVLGQTLNLDLLRTHSDTKILARPRILTLNNETAEIKVVTQEAVNISTIQAASGELSTETAETAERVETGVSLRVTPQVNIETGEITMFVLPMVKDTSISSLDSSIKDPEERSAKTTVRVKDGETVVIGGLIRHNKSETIVKVPVLGDMPFLGALFRHRNKDKDEDRELLVFITPHIVKEEIKEIAGLKKGLLPEREQDTLGGTRRELAIGSILNQYEKKNR